MTAEQIVKEKYRDAHCWPVLVIPPLYYVQAHDNYSEPEIGAGETESAAWEDAAKRLKGGK